MTFDNNYTDFRIIGVDPSKKNSEGEVYVICPQCEPYRKKQGQKKLAVNVNRGTWFCQHCAYTGGLTPEGWAKDKKTVKPENLMPLTDKQIGWFEKRGISLRTLTAREIQFKRITVRQKATDEFLEKDCVSFAYRENGALRMVKYRDGAKNFRIEKGSELIPYGIDWIKGSEDCIITEGEIDVLSYHEVKLPQCCSVPNGTTISKKESDGFKKTGNLITENHLSLKYFDKTFQYFEDKKTIYIGTDNDAAGIKLRNEIGRRFGFSRCKIIDYSLYSYKKGEETFTCKDANDVLMYCGPESLKNTLVTAKDFPIHDVVTIDDVRDKIMIQYDYGLTKGKPTGYECLAAHFTWRFGHLIGINGYGNNGKSFGMFNLTILASILYGWKWGMYLPENYPVEDAYLTFMEIYLGNTLDKDREGRATKEELIQAMAWVKEHFEFVSNEGGYSPAELRDVAKRMIMQRGIVGFVTDPWNALSHKWTTNLDNYLENELSAEQRFAINYKIIKIIVVHPPTPRPDEKKNPTAPSIYEISGGGIWSKKLYEAMCFHIEDKNARPLVTELHIQKVKFWKLTGIPTAPASPVRLQFKGRTNRFLEGSDFENDPFERAKQNEYESEELSDQEIF